MVVVSSAQVVWYKRKAVTIEKLFKKFLFEIVYAGGAGGFFFLILLPFFALPFCSAAAAVKNFVSFATYANFGNDGVDKRMGKNGLAVVFSYTCI